MGGLSRLMGVSCVVVECSEELDQRIDRGGCRCDALVGEVGGHVLAVLVGDGSVDGPLP